MNLQPDWQSIVLLAAFGATTIFLAGIKPEGIRRFSWLPFLAALALTTHLIFRMLSNTAMLGGYYFNQ